MVHNSRVNRCTCSSSCVRPDRHDAAELALQQSLSCRDDSQSRPARDADEDDRRLCREHQGSLRKVDDGVVVMRQPSRCRRRRSATIGTSDSQASWKPAVGWPIETSLR